MKGIILAGGSGSRLAPITTVTTKQLLPVYDKPMIHYPLTSLMLASITDILLITTQHDSAAFKELLGDGSQWGLSLSYAVQEEPDGIAQALIIAEDFLAGGPSCLILGDNIFFGNGLQPLLQGAAGITKGAVVLAYHVSDPESYGIVEFDKGGQAVSLEEKPKDPKSNWAITGLYFYDGTAPEKARALKPSPRGELEITDLNRRYLADGELEVLTMGRGFAWLDTGTPDSLLEAGEFVRTLEKRQGFKIACPEEIAFNLGYIDREQLRAQIETYPNCDYRRYLTRLDRTIR